MRHKLFAIIALLLVALAVPVWAQEQTGSIEGTVRDASGAVLPGVTIEVRNATRGGASTEVTRADGTYRLPSLAAGRYTVTATLAGFNPSTVPNVNLLLGQILRVDHVMRVGGVVEAITVTADAPLVDVKQSSSSTSVRSEEFEKLPVGRDFASVVTLTPGANRERTSGGISVDGASSSENKFVIDGVDTTDMRDGSQAKTLITDFVDEVQVKSAGYAAEFGGATGGVINVVTKGGTNQFKGEVYGYAMTDSANGSERPQLQLVLNSTTVAESPVYRKDKYSQYEPGITLGGPILRDRLFFFAAYQPQNITTSRVIDYVGKNAGTSREFENTTKTKYGTANVNGTLGTKFSYKLAANLAPAEREGLSFSTFPGTIGAQLAAINRNGRGSPTVNDRIGREWDNESYSAYFDIFPTTSLLASIRGGRFTTDFRDIGIPNEILHSFSANGADPAMFPDIPANLLRAPGFTSVATNTATVRDKYNRDAISADTTWYLRRGGEHAIKVGIQKEQISNDVFSGEQQPRIDYYWNLAHAGTGQRGKYGYFTVRQFATTGNVKQDTTAIFLQDAWTVRDRLTINAGIRAESEDVPQYREGAGTFIHFDYQDKVSPRLGFAYDLFGTGRTKLYGSFGTFFDVTKLEWPRGSSGGERWVDYHFTLDNPDWTKNICSVGNNTTADRPNCPGGTFITASDRRLYDPASVKETLDPNIKPMETREFSFGGEHSLSSTTSLGARYLHKELVRTIEDMGVLVGDDEIYIYGNPGSGLSRTLGAVPMPKATRDYDAVELEATKRFTSLSVHGSYTWSRLYGNYSGLANSDEVITATQGRKSPNVNRSFDGLAQGFDQNLDATYGLLPTDRPHQLKVQATYTAPFGTSIGINQYAGSGTPQTTEVNLYPTLPFFPYGRGDMGRTPWLTQTDLTLQHEVKFGGRYSVQFMLNVLNVFDEDTELYRWNRLLRADLPKSTGLTQFTFFDKPFDFNQVLKTNAAAVDPLRDPRYGKGFIFQDPRVVRLGARLRF